MLDITPPIMGDHESVETFLGELVTSGAVPKQGVLVMPQSITHILADFLRGETFERRQGTELDFIEVAIADGVWLTVTRGQRSHVGPVRRQRRSLARKRPIEYHACIYSDRRRHEPLGP